ncbi:MAG: hypothetical protein M1820_007039 [Bogoriella megaspora]|nr:MAG: hypothetical protein M1820_007039 [Bogoriella megaspora]
MSASNSSNIGTWVGVGVGAVGSGAGIVGAVGAVHTIRNTRQQNELRDLELGEVRFRLNLLEGDTSHHIGHEDPSGQENSIGNHNHQDHGITAPQEAHPEGEPSSFQGTSRLQEGDQQPDISQTNYSQPEAPQQRDSEPESLGRDTSGLRRRNYVEETVSPFQMSAD